MSIGAYQPFWISHERRLYAALHDCSDKGVARTGVVLVPPLLHEQHRSHRFLCEFASCLSELGVPCLRFSFFGTSDSEGAGEQMDLASMASDIERAVQALRERSRCASFVVIAFSSGVLPLSAWLGSGSVPRAAVLWDPILDGAAWLMDIEKMDERERNSLREKSPGHDSPDEDDGQLMGVAITEKLKGELAGTRWAGTVGAQRAPLWLVLRGEQREQGLPRQRSFSLPIAASAFGSSIGMENIPVLSPPLERVVQQLGLAVLAES